MPRRLLGLAFLLTVAACNSVLDIEQAQTISEDSDLSDGQDERGRFDIRPAEPKSEVATNLPAVSCAADEKPCFNKCVAIDDPKYGCGTTTCTGCALAHASRTKCASSACAILECDPEWDDCNGDPTDGCETGLLSARACGACGKACPASARFCVAMTCSPERP